MEIPVTNMKLLVIGHGRHGKDTVSEILNEKYDLSFESSSRFCSKLFIFNELKDKFGYETEEQCYADRHSHRELWYNMICEYNQNDPSRLGREIFKEHDIYCGLRNKREFHAIKNNNAVDFTIWVDRSDHLPPESKDSMSLEPWMADFVIDNNGSLEQLERNVKDLYNNLRVKFSRVKGVFA
jgi:hypothetical protein